MGQCQRNHHDQGVGPAAGSRIGRDQQKNPQKELNVQNRQEAEHQDPLQTTRIDGLGPGEPGMEESGQADHEDQPAQDRVDLGNEFEHCFPWEREGTQDNRGERVLASSLIGLTVARMRFIVYRNYTIKEVPMPIRWKVKPQVEEAAERELAGFFKALGHPVRIHLMRVLLEEGPSPCGDLVASVPLAQSTVSQHLRQLKTSGLVEDEIQGVRRVYRVRSGAVDRLRKYTLDL